MLRPADGEIGQNSLEMIPFPDQEYNDFCTGEILVAAVKARSDYSCSGALPESFAPFGPVVQDTVQQTQSLTRQNVLSQQAATTQKTVNDYSVPVITDEDIANAPRVVPVGSTSIAPVGDGGGGSPYVSGGSSGGGSPFGYTDAARTVFSPQQIAAANGQPVNWAAELTIDFNTKRNQAAHAKHKQEMKRRMLQAQAPPFPPGTGTDLVPAPAWGRPAAATQGWCNLGSNPWGKLFLFVGLGLIGAGLLEGRK